MTNALLDVTTTEKPKIYFIENKEYIFGFEEEVEVLTRSEKTPPIEILEAVVSLEELVEMQQLVKEVYVQDVIKYYIVDITRQTREHKDIFLGASPRAAIALMKASQALAFISGRDYVIPDDVQYLVPYVLSHRLILKPDVKYQGITPEMILESIVKKTRVPIKRIVT